MPIKINRNMVTDAAEKAGIFANSIQSNYSLGKHKCISNFADKLRSAQLDDNGRGYNSMILKEELLYAIQICKIKSPGMDKITNGLLKHIPEEWISEYLGVLNQSYMTGQVPE